MFILIIPALLASFCGAYCYMRASRLEGVGDTDKPFFLAFLILQLVATLFWMIPLIDVFSTNDGTRYFVNGAEATGFMNLVYPFVISCVFAFASWAIFLIPTYLWSKLREDSWLKAAEKSRDNKRPIKPQAFDNLSIAAIPLCLVVFIGGMSATKGALGNSLIGMFCLLALIALAGMICGTASIVRCVKAQYRILVRVIVGISLNFALLLWWIWILVYNLMRLDA
jgi:hypothetical protein